MFVNIDICRLKVTYVKQQHTQKFCEVFPGFRIVFSKYRTIYNFSHIRDIVSVEKHPTQLLENTRLNMGRLSKIEPPKKLSFLISLDTSGSSLDQLAAFLNYGLNCC